MPLYTNLQDAYQVAIIFSYFSLGAYHAARTIEILKNLFS
jgi:hypothetical protein